MEQPMTLSEIAVMASAFGSCASAVAAALSSLFAWRNSRSYFRNLTNQRIDDCISSGQNLRGTIQRTLANKYAKDLRKRPITETELWSMYGDMWHSWRSFNQSFVVLSRYRADLDKAIPDKLQHVLFRIQSILESDWTDPIAADQIRKGLEDEASELITSIQDAEQKIR
jgi:hypothetical protein